MCKRVCARFQLPCSPGSCGQQHGHSRCCASSWLLLSVQQSSPCDIRRTVRRVQACTSRQRVSLRQLSARRLQGYSALQTAELVCHSVLHAATHSGVEIERLVARPRATQPHTAQLRHCSAVPQRCQLVRHTRKLGVFASSHLPTSSPIPSPLRQRHLPSHPSTCRLVHCLFPPLASTCGSTSLLCTSAACVVLRWRMTHLHPLHLPHPTTALQRSFPSASTSFLSLVFHPPLACRDWLL